MFPDFLALPEFVPAEPSVLTDEAAQADYLVIRSVRCLSCLCRAERVDARQLAGSDLARCPDMVLAGCRLAGEAYNMLYAMSYTNEEQPLSREISSLLYGSKLTASVSRMERFAACPFLQFVTHGLRLKERPIYRLEAPDIGQLFHAAPFGAQARDEQRHAGTDVGALHALTMKTATWTLHERLVRVGDEYSSTH